jgi:hypothetical protein
METIYTANLLQVFGWRLLIALIIFVAGAGFAWQQLRDRSAQRNRGWGCLSLVGAAVVSLYLIGLVFISFASGTRTLTAELTIKRLISDGESSSYNLDFVMAQTDFDVPKRAYDLVEQGECYQVTYYHDYLADYNPITMLLGEVYVYESSPFVTKIAQPAEPSACE